MKKFTNNLRMSVLALLCLVFYAFSALDPLNEQTIYVQKKLIEHYDADQDGASVKSYELKVTNSGFCRYKRHFSNGKIEYFSFNISKFKNMDYVGNTSNGKIYLETLSDDVIVQTYNDKRGDVDSMASCMKIPLRNIEPEDLNDFTEKFQAVNSLLLAQKQ
jgi:hypothetical protein